MMRTLWGALLCAAVTVGDAANATSCATEDMCLCRWEWGATVVADVEVVAIDRNITSVQVNRATADAGIDAGETLKLARASTDELGQRRFLYFDGDRSLVHVVPVIDDQVSCAITQRAFTLPADTAFQFADDQTECSDEMHAAGLVAPECSGVSSGPSLPGGCSTSPDTAAGVAMLVVGAVLGRRRRRRIEERGRCP